MRSTSYTLIIVIVLLIPIGVPIFIIGALSKILCSFFMVGYHVWVNTKSKSIID